MQAQVTFLGHSTVLVEMGGLRVLTDPVLFDRITLLRRTVSPLPPELYADVDVVVISHAHHDHLDLGSLRLLCSRANEPRIFVPRGLGALLRGAGFSEVRELPLGTAGRVSGLRIVPVPAIHSGFRWPFGPAAEAIGYLLEEGSERVYFAGDTDIYDAMTELTGVDLALLPVWGWGPTLGSGHLDPLRAARALQLIQPVAAVPIHWGTLWPLGLGRVVPGRLQWPPLAFAEHAAEMAPGVDVLVTPPGESVPIPR